MFYSKPNVLISLKDNQFQEKILQTPSEDISFDEISILKSDVYFLERQSGEIIKYPSPLSKESPDFKFWLDPKIPQAQKPIGAKSITIDGSIWILTENNEINRYFKGFYKETLKFNLFPYLENPTKI